jgi:asparagine synthase (glutamine-hydrolysing)
MSFLLGGFGKGATKYNNPNQARLHEKTIYKSEDDLFWIIAQEDEHASLIQGSGILIGKLFDKATNNAIHVLEPEISTDDLMNLKWGRYAGALYDAASKQLSLIRDPLGLSTLFYAPIQDGIIFSTQLSVLYDILEQKPEIDWFYFAEYILEHHVVTKRTPFKGVFELLPGMVSEVNLENCIKEHYKWHIPEKTNKNPESIEEILSQNLKNSVMAWTSGQREITVELSGGVDSSSVLSLVKHHNPDMFVRGVHYNDSKNPSSQEITYAQQIAQDCGISLDIIDYQSAKLLDPLPSDYRPSKPTMFLTYYSMSQQLKSYAQNSMIMSGQGGDHVFLAPPPLESIADYWIDNGLRGISAIAQEISAYYRIPLSQLSIKTISTLKNYYTKQNCAKNHCKSPINDSLTKQIKKSPFYINEILKNYPPGKAAQIKSLWHAIAYADRDQRFINCTITHPLLSSPVVEYALTIPTYLSFHNGYNRYFLRKAVSQTTSSSVIWRRNKGKVTTSILKSAIAEFDTICSLLSNGNVLKSGIIDNKWFNEACTQIRHGNSSNLLLFLRVVNVELWLGQWKL